MAITVIEPPATVLLCQLEDLKELLGITDGSKDTLLEGIITRASGVITQSLNRFLAQRTVTETLRGSGGNSLRLKFFPIVSVDLITLDGDVVAADEYALNEPETGIIYSDDGFNYTTGYGYAVTYTHGYKMPGETNRDLPYALEQAALELSKTYYYAKSRDSNVISESVPDVYSVKYATSSNGGVGNAMPQNVLDLIEPFRNYHL